MRNVNAEFCARMRDKACISSFSIFKIFGFLIKYSDFSICHINWSREFKFSLNQILIHRHLQHLENQCWVFKNNICVKEYLLLHLLTLSLQWTWRISHSLLPTNSVKSSHFGFTPCKTDCLNLFFNCS